MTRTAALLRAVSWGLRARHFFTLRELALGSYQLGLQQASML